MAVTLRLDALSNSQARSFMTAQSEMKGESSLYFGTFSFISMFRFDKASTASLACPDGMPLL